MSFKNCMTRWLGNQRQQNGVLNGLEKREADEFELVMDLMRAACELENCRRYFHMVSEPHLVDRAVYLLMAAEKRYSHILQQARNRNLPEAFLPRFEKLGAYDEIVLDKTAGAQINSMNT